MVLSPLSKSDRSVFETLSVMYVNSMFDRAILKQAMHSSFHAYPVDFYLIVSLCGKSI